MIVMAGLVLDKPGHDEFREMAIVKQSTSMAPPSRDVNTSESFILNALEKWRAQGKPGVLRTRSLACE